MDSEFNRSVPLISFLGELSGPKYQTALYYSQWEICNYLMDLGAELSAKLPIHRVSLPTQTCKTSPFSGSSTISKLINRNQERQSQLIEDIVGVANPYLIISSATGRAREAERRKLIGRLDDDDNLRLSFLSGFEGTFDEFTSLRSSTWPNDRFCHTEFSQQRMRFAISIACARTNAMAAPSMIRSVLQLDSRKSQATLDLCTCNSFRMTIFHGLSRKIAITAGTQDSADWHHLTCDILTHVTDVRVLTQDSDSMLPLKFMDTGGRTALKLLIFESIYMGSQSRRPGVKGPSAVIHFCERIIVAWLEDLYKSGIDLAEYGRNEKCCHLSDSIHTATGVFPSVFAHTVGGFAIFDHYTLLCSLRLVNFQYGRLPTEWKFWWAEPSDKFAGDFWRLIELDSTTAAMSVPGAWVD